MTIATSGATALLIGLTALTSGLIVVLAAKLAVDAGQRAEESHEGVRRMMPGLAAVLDQEEFQQWLAAGLAEFEVPLRPGERMKLDEVDETILGLKSFTRLADPATPLLSPGRRELFLRGQAERFARRLRDDLQPAYGSVMNLTLDDASMFTSSQQDHIGAVVRFVQVVDRRDSERWRVTWTSEPELE